jgi:UDP-N-acetylmuramate dehydrogenase
MNLRRLELKHKVSLKNYTTIRVGGIARYFFSLHNIDHLHQVMRYIDEPPYILGGGSNILIKDKIIEKPVIKLGEEFSYIKDDGKIIEVGGATPFPALVKYCLEHKWGGIENLIGIPATIGGMLVMNASAFGRDISSSLMKVEILDKNKNIRQLNREDISFSYRSSSLKGKIILKAWFKFTHYPSFERGSIKVDILKEKSDYFFKMRKDTQPLFYPAEGVVFTCGCIFKNHPYYSAGELIEKCGFKGAERNDALVSPQHANFIINRGNASYNDIDYLIQKIKEKVYHKYRIMLEEEIERWT